MNRAALAFVPLALAALATAGAACSASGENAFDGATEPIAVANGQFLSGDLPGSPPTGTLAGQGGAPIPPQSVLEVDYSDLTVYPGAANKGYSVIVSSDSSALGVRLADQGSGYWVVPVGARDALVPNASDVSFNASFQPDIAPGTHALRVVALDASGNGGTQVDTNLCFLWRVPDNGHSCDPTKPVPAVVFSLQWDANFDVDLHVVDPNGTDINPKTNMVQFPVDAGAPPTNDPRIDRDSLGHCVPDGLRQEDLVFQDYPLVGAYDVYADPFDACGQAAVRFVLTIYEAGDDGELHATYTQAGELLSSSVTGGGSPGLFIAEKQFN